MDEVLYDSKGSVATVTINRPDHRNALSFRTLSELREAIDWASHDPAVRALVLTGAGDKAFCSGADLRGLRGDPGASEVAHSGRGELAELFQTMWSCGIPTIARVSGYALAGGFGLALSCDFVIAAENAVFGAPEVHVGLWPYMVTIPMLRSMPPKVALDLMITGRRVSAEEGKTFGFVTDVVAAVELDDRIGELTTAICKGSPTAIALGRTSFYQTLSLSISGALPLLHNALSVATTTSDASEGIEAFIAKRPPRWLKER